MTSGMQNPHGGELAAFPWIGSRTTQLSLSMEILLYMGMQAVSLYGRVSAFAWPRCSESATRSGWRLGWLPAFPLFPSRLQCLREEVLEEAGLGPG